MIDRQNTITVGELLSMLANGLISADMPIVINDGDTSVLRGSMPVIEVYKLRDGSKALALFQGGAVGVTSNVVATCEVFP